MPNIIRPSLCSSASARSSSPVFLPPYMTMIRSLSSMTSSRSAEMSSTALPASRISMSILRMYSDAPMSTPRVGWQAMMTRGFLESSRATTTFCMLPPERFLQASSGEDALI